MNHTARAWPGAANTGSRRVRVAILLFATVAALASWLIISQVFAATGDIFVQTDFEVADNSGSTVGGTVVDTLEASSQGIKNIGDTFDVDIVVTNAVMDPGDEIDAVNLLVTFDPLVATVNTAIGDDVGGIGANLIGRGDDGGGFFFEIGPTIDNGAGTVTYIGAVAGAGAAGVAGDGRLLRLTFLAVGPGDAMITVGPAPDAGGNPEPLFNLDGPGAGSDVPFTPAGSNLLGGATAIPGNLSTLDDLTVHLDATAPSNLVTAPLPFDGVLHIVPAFVHVAGVANTVTTVDIVATPTDPLATVQITSEANVATPSTVGPTAPSPGTTILLDDATLDREARTVAGAAVREDDFLVTVTSQDGLDVTEYRVRVTRAPDDTAPTLDAPTAVSVAPDTRPGAFVRATPNAGGNDAAGVVQATDMITAVAAYTDGQTATDNVDPAPTVTIQAAKDAPYDVGLADVMWDLTDFAGNAVAAAPTISQVLTVEGVAANTDAAADGFTNGEELAVNTDPNRACSDDAANGGFANADVWPPDFNGDTVANSTDFAIFAAAFGTLDERADFGDFDDVVDFTDFGAFLNHIDTTCTGFAP